MVIEVRVLWDNEVVHIAHCKARGMRLEPDAFERFEAENGVAYEVRAIAEDPRLRRAELEPTPALSTGLSMLLHVGLLATLAALMPLHEEDSVGAHRTRIDAMRHLLVASDSQQTDSIIPTLDDDMRDDSGKTEGGTGSAAKGSAGLMGRKATGHVFATFAIPGWNDNHAPEATRRTLLEESQTFGMIEALDGNGRDTPSAVWAKTSVGNDARAAVANMWGDAIGDAYGTAGLGLSGTGAGGGGLGEGIGIGTVGTIGRGLGHGIGGGVGSGHGHLEGGHTAGPPFIRSGATTVNGRLPPDAIQRVVRQNFGRFRMCYEDGLRMNPTLAGRAVVRFVIDSDGSVATAVDGGSDVPPRVSDCVVRQFANLAFPAPVGGVVTVVYPIVFVPAG